MNYVIKDNSISYIVDGKVCGDSTFPLVEGRENLININSTYVNSSLRGQGIGSQLMKKIVEESKLRGWEILPTCPFATAWFEKHPEYHYLLRTDLGK